MSSLLSKVSEAITELGKAPYDDEKTRAAVDKATEEVYKLFNALEESEKVSKRC